jgi:hypothetical protein
MAFTGLDIRVTQIEIGQAYFDLSPDMKSTIFLLFLIYSLENCLMPIDVDQILYKTFT